MRRSSVSAALCGAPVFFIVAGTASAAPSLGMDEVAAGRVAEMIGQRGGLGYLLAFGELRDCSI